MSGHVANADLLCAAYNASKAGVSLAIDRGIELMIGESVGQESRDGVVRQGD